MVSKYMDEWTEIVARMVGVKGEDMDALMGHDHSHHHRQGRLASPPVLPGTASGWRSAPGRRRGLRSGWAAAFFRFRYLRRDRFHETPARVRFHSARHTSTHAASPEHRQHTHTHRCTHQKTLPHHELITNPDMINPGLTKKSFQGQNQESSSRCPRRQ